MKKEALVWILGVILYVNGQNCPPGWVDGPLGKKCYLFAQNHKTNWFDAMYICQSMRAELLSIEDATEMAWIKQEFQRIKANTAGNKEWWLSLNNQKNVTNWVWTTDRGDIPFDESAQIVRWGSGEPNNYKDSERCAEICCPYYLNDINCEKTINYICELDKEKYPLTCEADNGWEYHSGSCYKFVKKFKTWNESVSDCWDLDSDLAVVSDSYSQSAVSVISNFQQLNSWIGVIENNQAYFYSNSSRALGIDSFLQTGKSTVNMSPVCLSVNSTSPDNAKNLYPDDCTSSKPYICQKPEGVCKPGMLQHQSSCFYVSGSEQSRIQAERLCSILKMSLVDVTSRSKSVYLQSILKKKTGLNEVWIGLKKQGDHWYWPSTGEAPSFDYWIYVDPSSNETLYDCAYMNIGDEGRWSQNFPCDRKLRFVCEVPAVTSFTTTTVTTPTTSTTPITTTTAMTTVPVGGVTNPTTTTVRECRMNQMGTDYRGTQSKTYRGRTCQAWASLTPHQHNFQQLLLTDSNYCRNPDNEPGGPWCYTTDVNQRWEYCYIPYCPGAITSPTREPITPSTTETIPFTVPTTIPTTYSDKCGLFWEDSPMTDICYHFDDQLVDWMTARTKCEDIDGELTSITSIQEQHYLAGRLHGSMLDLVWIGANSRGSDEGWRWSDGAPFSLLNWLPGQPDGLDNDEDCVAMNTDTGLWEDQQCSNQEFGFVCRKSVAPPTPPPIPSKSPVIGPDQMYSCQEGWVSYRSNCYLIARNKTTWKDAQSYCRKNGGDLASILEEGEQDFVTSQLPQKFCYNIHSNDTECNRWRDQGECQKNPAWMARNCHLACNLCIKDCKNIHYSLECDHWANAGECYNNPSFMVANCALSCGICDGAIYGGFWIGLSDRSLQMSFDWSDDSKVTFTKWSKGEPNNWNGESNEDCTIMLLKNGYWNDVSCNMVNPGFICKKRRQVLDKVTESPFSAGCVNDTLGFDAYCYGIHDETADWDTAEKICAKSQYGHLATINDIYIQLFLASQLAGRTGDYWIGLSQDASSGVVESWNSGLSVMYTAWARSHTGSIDEDAMCVAMASSHPIGLWETKNCTLEKSFICEYPREGFTTSTTTTTTMLPPTCPGDWQEFNNYCYKSMSTRQKSWMKSRDYCRERGADLVSIHSDQEDSFVQRNLISYYGDIWIGLNDRDYENGYLWSDGSPVDFLSWGPGEPNDKYQQEDCVMKNKYRSGWNDDNCYKNKKVVCKILKGMPLTEPNDTYTQEYCDSSNDWLYFNNYCYYISKVESGSYSNAEKKCFDKNSQLVSIHSQHEMNWILEMISYRTNDMWIGLNKLNRHVDGYSWSDNTPLDFVHWSDNEPTLPQINKCVKLQSSTGRWHDYHCFGRVSGYICKRKNGTTSLPETPPPLPPTKGGCLGGFIRSTFNDKCYQLIKVQKTWNEARQACMAYNDKSYNLVTIESELEQMFIASLLVDVGEVKVWIGLTDVYSYRKFYWDDGTEVTYTNWESKEPNGYNEHCGDLFVENGKFGHWNDETCTRSLYYICQGRQNEHIPIDNPDSDGCPQSYKKYDSKCYKFVESISDWNTSLTQCQQDGGSLASIQNLAEKNFIGYLTYNKSSTPFWIGLNKINSKDDITYKWSNGWQVTYTRWNPDAPSPTKPCIAVDTDFWTDQDCNKQLPYVCQIDKNNPPITPDSLACKEGGYIHSDKCYYPRLHNPLPWQKAKLDCDETGLMLSTIQNMDQIEFMVNLVLKLSGFRQKLWIGLSKLDRSSYAWTWVNKKPLIFENWNSGEPSTSWHSTAEECVEMKPDGKWNDLNCYNYERPYFCIGDPVKKGEESTTIPATTVTTNETTATVPIETTVATKQPLKSTTIPQYVVVDPNQEDISSKQKVSDNTPSLTTGQIVGILIGLMGCLLIVSAILFVIRFHKQKGTYNTNSHSFANALYLKTTEDVNEEDPNAMGSTVKICSGTDTL